MLYGDINDWVGFNLFLLTWQWILVSRDSSLLVYVGVICMIQNFPLFCLVWLRPFWEQVSRLFSISDIAGSYVHEFCHPIYYLSTFLFSQHFRVYWCHCCCCCDTVIIKFGFHVRYYIRMNVLKSTMHFIQNKWTQIASSEYKHDLYLILRCE